MKTWTEKHIEILQEKVHNLKVSFSFLFDDDVEDKLDELYEQIEKAEKALDWLIERLN